MCKTFICVFYACGGKILYTQKKKKKNGKKNIAR